MKFYPDASLMVATITEEGGSERSDKWLAGLQTGDLFTSGWCRTEVASALGLKVRRGVLEADRRAPLLAGFDGLLAASAKFVEVTPACFDLATDLLMRSTLPLRGGDALHLAIASHGGARLVTLDVKMAAAGAVLGLDVELLT